LQIAYARAVFATLAILGLLELRPGEGDARLWRSDRLCTLASILILVLSGRCAGITG